MSKLRSNLSACAAVLALAALAAGPAAAADVAGLGASYTSADAPLGAPTELRIDLRGRVAARCDLTRPAPLEGLTLNRPGRAESDFGIDCNAPFVLTVRSEGGGFRNVTPTPGIEPVLPYELAVTVGTDRGSRRLGWCASDAVGAAPVTSCPYAATAPEGGWSSGEATAIDQAGRLSVRWQENVAERPLLGSYRDVLVIQVEARS